MNFGNRSQIWPARTFSPGRFSILVAQIQARMKAQMAMNTSMNTFTVVVTPMIQPGLY